MYRRGYGGQSVYTVWMNQRIQFKSGFNCLARTRIASMWLYADRGQVRIAIVPLLSLLVSKASAARAGERPFHLPR
eukprot:8679701-Pyramimonas_sp.AAC.1